MKIPLSERLQCCASFISGGIRVADIGCDHGYLGIHLLKEGLATSVIASDVNEGPLQSALHNARRYGVSDQMTFYLSDGVRNIPRDFDALVCAGMGADTMIHILEDAPWLRSGQYFLVLQCQSKTPMLRRYLSDTGWCIVEESILRDGKFLYTVMLVRWQPDAPRLTPGQCYISPALMRSKSPAVGEYIERIVAGLHLAVAHQNDTEKRTILEELENDPELGCIREVCK